jgi:3-hydroxyisobutyrate dehydrogenase-like beta-hydroxyacid dehydrogenase
MEQDVRVTVGVLYPGDMGSAVAKMLAAGGFRVCTVVEGRSQRTRERCRAAGLKVLPSLRELLDCSDVVISLVTPSAARQVAGEVAALARDSPRKLLYVDANSTTPAVTAEIARLLRSANSQIEFLDGAIHGVATKLRELGVLYLSGPGAEELASQIRPLMRVQVVGPTPGQASALKMILSGISKGLNALFVETMVMAREYDLLDEALEGSEHFYPGFMEAVTRILPTYPLHAARRRDELKEIEAVMRKNGLTPRVVSASRDVIAEMAGIEWSKGRESGRYSIQEIIEQVHEKAATHPAESVAADAAGADAA